MEEGGKTGLRNISVLGSPATPAYSNAFGKLSYPSTSGSLREASCQEASLILKGSHRGRQKQLPSADTKHWAVKL